MRRSALLAGMAAFAAASQNYRNAYEDLAELDYMGSKASRKPALTKSQLKARKKSKRARKARRNNR